MKASTLFKGLLLFLGLLLSSQAIGQNKFDALRYTQFNPGNDPYSLAISGATMTRFAGFGSIYQNPAVAGLAKMSEFSVGVGYREVNETGYFMNTRSRFNDDQIGVSNLGYLYSFPTHTGSLVIGGGYQQTASFNRASSLDLFNNSHSIVDHFLWDPGNQYFDPAFNTYAIDYDDFYDEYFNVLRADGNFRGMNQYAEIRERGQMGEFNIFLGTEFQPGLFIGGSVGIVTGSYKYRRSFVEEDLRGNYRNAIYDVESILNEDRIDASISGVNAKIGALYNIVPGLRLGISYTTRTVLNIEEQYSTFIRTDYYTTDNDGFNRYEDDFLGEIDYTVRRPSVLSAGIGFYLMPNIDFDLSVDRMNYSKIEMGGLGFSHNREQNSSIRQEFEDVYNVKAGLTLNVSDSFKPSLGYAFNPSPRSGYDAGITYWSVGARLYLGENVTLDAGLQYAVWDDQLDVYSYGSGVATMRQEVERIQGMIGINFRF